MPAEAKNTRYVVQKSVTGSLNFAAVMAQAARIFEKFENIVPGLADSTLHAANRAWEWALENPEKFYNQNELNEQFNPDILTGAYGDNDASDEFFWAAVELFITTGDRSYLDKVDLFPAGKTSVPNWRNVRTMGIYSLAKHGNGMDHTTSGDVSSARELVIELADSLIEGVSGTGYRVMDRDESNYVWGSSGVAANQGMALIQAYLLTDDRKYLEYAHSNMDYLLGRNATGYSFLTGHGHNTPLHIHHRPSDASALREPVPGLLSGGPNPGQQDECIYPSDFPAKSFIDDWCSYASNEIAINWNAPMVYLSAGLEALQFKAGFSSE